MAKFYTAILPNSKKKPFWSTWAKKKGSSFNIEKKKKKCHQHKSSEKLIHSSEQGNGFFCCCQQSGPFKKEKKEPLFKTSNPWESRIRQWKWSASSDYPLFLKSKHTSKWKSQNFRKKTTKVQKNKKDDFSIFVSKKKKLVCLRW